MKKAAARNSLTLPKLIRSRQVGKSVQAAIAFACGTVCFISGANADLVGLVALEQEGVVWLIGRGPCRLVFAVSPTDVGTWLRFRVTIYHGSRYEGGDHLVVSPTSVRAVMRASATCRSIQRIVVGPAECARDHTWRQRVSCPISYGGGEFVISATAIAKGVTAVETSFAHFYESVKKARADSARRFNQIGVDQEKLRDSIRAAEAELRQIGKRLQSINVRLKELERGLKGGSPR